MKLRKAYYFQSVNKRRKNAQKNVMTRSSLLLNGLGPEYVFLKAVFPVSSPWDADPRGKNHKNTLVLLKIGKKR